MDDLNSHSEQPPADLADPILHNQLGDRYDVLERLGEGPLVISYRGRDRTLNRLVSVKTLLPAFSGKKAVRDRLKNGLGRTLALSSPRVVRAYDVGAIHVSGQPILFWVEEYIRGINLKERIRRAAPFQLAAATDTVIAIAEALEYAHGRGLPHGDLRPQNVLIGPEGQIKVTGFGIADAQAVAIQDDPDSIRLIDYYSAPEFVPGSIATTDADLYALGVILFELLNGELRRNESAVGDSTRTDRPTLAMDLRNSELPRAVQGILGKATMPSPEGRYVSAASLLTDLRAVREALRYGKDLNWSPLDATATRDFGTSATLGLFRPTSAGAMPLAAAAAAENTLRKPEESFLAVDTEATITMAIPESPALLSPRLPAPATAKAQSGGILAGERRTVNRDGLKLPADWAASTPPRRDEQEKDERPVPRDDSQRDNGGGGANRYLTSLNLFLFVLVVAGIGVLGWMTTSFLKPAPEVVVPNLVGRTITDAKELASEEKFDLAVVDEQFRESEATGVIYQMQPAPGRHIREGKPISIWVSKGPRMVDVPDVSSMTLEKAKQVIESNNLKVGDSSFQYDAVEPKGNVLSQNPAAGQSRPHGTQVSLVLSKGEEPAPTPVPDMPTPPPPVSSPASETPASPLDAAGSGAGAQPTAAPSAGSGDQSDADAKVRTFDVKYPVPSDGAPHRVRIDVTDRDGTRTVFDESHNAGETVKQRIEAVGKTIHIRLFDNDQLLKELVK